MLAKLKREVWRLHLLLPKYGLVVWSGGNVSARDPASNLVVIKPSGVLYEDLRPADHVVVDLDGKVIEGKLKVSSDTASHLYIYRRRPDVNGVVHTHSPYATAFAALGRPIPVHLTGMADEFGGPIPCAGFALIGGEEIGKLVVETLGQSPAVTPTSRRPSLPAGCRRYVTPASRRPSLPAGCRRYAVLLQNHGVFTVGKTAEEAVKAAVMAEDAARTTWLALQLGAPKAIAPADVAKLHRRYTQVYGQTAGRRPEAGGCRNGGGTARNKKQGTRNKAR